MEAFTFLFKNIARQWSEKMNCNTLHMIMTVTEREIMNIKKKLPTVVIFFRI